MWVSLTPRARMAGSTSVLMWRKFQLGWALTRKSSSNQSMWHPASCDRTRRDAQSASHNLATVSTRFSMGQ